MYNLLTLMRGSASNMLMADYYKYLIDNHDPFSKANVLSRGIVGDLKGHNVVASPIYKQHFCLETGKCLEEDTQIPVYKVRENAGKVEVFLG